MIRLMTYILTMVLISILMMRLTYILTMVVLTGRCDDVLCCE